MVTDKGSFSRDQSYIKSAKATTSWNIVHRHSHALKIKVNNHRILILFYCLTTFCNIKFFKYPQLGIFYLGLQSSFVLIKPSAVQYKLSISFRWGTCTLSFFSCSRPVNMLVIKQLTCEFLFFEPLRVSQKFCDIKYPFAFLESFGISSILTLMSGFCILNSNGID